MCPLVYIRWFLSNGPLNGLLEMVQTLQKNRVSSSVSRNITVLYSSVSKPRKISGTDEHRALLTDKYIVGPDEF
jgi:hypothetical protein